MTPETCGAAIFMGDDYGDNHATFICSQPKDHEGWHMEEGRGRKYRLAWEKDERCICPRCGKLGVRYHYCTNDEYCPHATKAEYLFEVLKEENVCLCEDCMGGDGGHHRYCPECEKMPKCQKHGKYPAINCFRCEMEKRDIPQGD